MADFANILVQLGPNVYVHASRVVAVMRVDKVRGKRLRLQYKKAGKYIDAVEYDDPRDPRRPVKTLIITDADWAIGSGYKMPRVIYNFHQGLLKVASLRRELAESLAEILVDKEVMKHGKKVSRG